MSPVDQTARRRYFAILLLAEVAVFGYLVLERRLPRSHDTLSVFLLQYIFMAGPVTGHGPALWMPFLSHGVSSTWLSFGQFSLLQSTLQLANGVPSGTSMLPIFYGSLFLEDLILLIGVWKLGQRLYRSPAAQFFTAASAIGSSMWISNVYWQHRLIFGVPLALSLLLDFVETGNRPRLLLAASLGSLLLLSGPPYIPVLSGIAIIVFLGLYVLLHRRRLRAAAPHLRPRLSDAAWIGGIVLVTGAVLGAILADIGSIRQYTRGRSADGSVSLDAFLTYAGGSNPLRYLDCLFGLNPSEDFSVYAGLCTPIFAALAFTRQPRRNVIVAALSLFLFLLFSLGYLHGTAMLSYTAIPPLHFFRYISLTSGLVKLFLILLSGFGFDAIVRDAPRKPFAIGVMAAAGLLLVQWCYLAITAGQAGDPIRGLLMFVQDDLAVRAHAGRPEFGMPLLVLLFGAGAAIAVWRRGGRASALAIPLLLVLHGADLARWRLQILREESMPMTDEQFAAQTLRPFAYIARRSIDPEEPGVHPPTGLHAFAVGSHYDYSDAFLRRDASWSRYYVTIWSPYVDLLLRARAGRPLTGDPERPPGFIEGTSPARTVPEAFARIIGERAGKLQVFAASHSAASDEEIARLMLRPDYRGDTLLLSGGAAAGPLDPSLAWKNERLEADQRVLNFDPDRLRVEVDVPPDHPQAWMAYCDAWDPRWTAEVDGSAERVERANLAYKAVRLHTGRNVVEFRFRSPFRAMCYVLIGIQSVLWILLLGGWSLRYLGIPVPELILFGAISGGA